MRIRHRRGRRGGADALCQDHRKRHHPHHTACRLGAGGVSHSGRADRRGTGCRSGPDHPRSRPAKPGLLEHRACAEAAEFMVPAAGVMHDMAEGAVTSVMKVMGLQITGGSTTVPDQFDKLRHAGASARETIKALVAKREGVAIGALTTPRGQGDFTRRSGNPLYRSRRRSGGCRGGAGCASARALAMALYRPADAAARHAGQSTGTQDYGIDAAVDGMVHATGSDEPRAGRRLESFDATEAMKRCAA